MKIYWNNEGSSFDVYGAEQRLETKVETKGRELPIMTQWQETYFLIWWVDCWHWVKASECEPWEEEA